MKQSVMKGFHSQDGLWFSREENGSVRITKFESGHNDAPLLFEQVLDDGTWCSIVLTMSAFSERPNDWYCWMEHHQGKRDLLEIIKAIHVEELKAGKPSV